MFMLCSDFFHNQIWQEVLQMLYNVVLRHIEELLIELLHLGSILLIIIFLCCKSWEKKLSKNHSDFHPLLNPYKGELVYEQACCGLPVVLLNSQQTLEEMESSVITMHPVNWTVNLLIYFFCNNPTPVTQSSPI